MVEVKMPSEVREYKSKLVFGLSVRQFASIVAALVICVPLGVWGHDKIPSDLLTWVIILIAGLCGAVGFITISGMPFEDFAKAFLAMQFLPQRRVYEDTEDNILVGLLETALEADIVQQRIEYGDYEIVEEDQEGGEDT